MFKFVLPLDYVCLTSIIGEVVPTNLLPVLLFGRMSHVGNDLSIMPVSFHVYVYECTFEVLGGT